MNVYNEYFPGYSSVVISAHTKLNIMLNSLAGRGGDGEGTGRGRGGDGEGTGRGRGGDGAGTGMGRGGDGEGTGRGQGESLVSF